MPKPHIEVENLQIRYGDVAAVRGVSFEVMPGEQLTLLGPSGCGKTTTLRAIAGLEQPAAGEIRIAGVPVYSSARNINIPAEKRGLSMVFQSYAIWPHMTVFDNVAYGLRVRKAGSAEIKSKVEHALGLVQMQAFAQRRASQLSGGQQQRVALARAFVFQPSVLLFDEPLSNLDAKLRADMRIELRQLQHRLGITSVYVTHDLEEALAMSDHIVVMRDGLIEQTGAPDDIYSLPRSAFVADFIGSANLIRGRNRPDLAFDGLIALETSDGRVIYGMSYGRPVGDELVVSVRTVHLRISSDPPAETRNVWPVRVEQSVFQGDFTQVLIGWGNQRLVARCAAMEPIAAGREIYMSIEPRRVVLLGA
ncbi:MAG TPA: ABC transporter ATP-binding protein [Polyangiaceae bacterium]|nr:ABC transporter ATP-binding protein [Polyangiaceae bacterium]